MTGGTAEAFFIAGGGLFLVAGAAHALGAVFDARRPTFFTPVDDSVRIAAARTGIRFRRGFHGDQSRPSMWNAWLGFNISHGLGAFTFGLMCTVVALHDYRLVASIGGLRPLTIAVSATYLAISLRFWFWGPTLAPCAAATACFTVAAVLS